MAAEKKRPTPRGNYIPNALARYSLNGDAFVPVTDAYQICCENHRVSYGVFQEDLQEQVRLGKVILEGNRLYLKRTLRYEESVARHLANLLPRNALSSPSLPAEMRVGPLVLTEEQREAVQLALSNRLSIILGGAGSGKTTLIRAIVRQFGGKYRMVLAAPTGKAARNLTDRTGLESRTVHSALGMRPDDDF